MTSRHPIAVIAAALLTWLAPTAQADGGVPSKLLPVDGEAGDEFGFAVAVGGATAVVTAPDEDDNGPGSGAVYLLDAATGQQTAKLLAADGAAGDRFGTSVSVSAGLALVGASCDDDKGADSGSAYLFDVATGQQVAKLLASDGAPGDGFGGSVGLSGTLAIVGALGRDDNGPDSGAAYLFDATTGQQVAKLLPGLGAPEDFFGVSVAISGATAIVGATGVDDNGSYSGAAYLFDTNTGQQIAKLLPADGALEEYFGLAVAISGSRAIVGTPWDGANGFASGAAYLFDTTTGQELAKLLPADGSVSGWFGNAVAIQDGSAVVGARGADDNGSFSGAAYLFDVATGAELAKFLPLDGAQGDDFGGSVALDGTTVLVGARADDDFGASSGSAYVVALEDPAIGANYCGPAQLNSSGSAARIAAYGSDVAADDCVLLVAVRLPVNQPGYFLNSMGPGFVQPPGSQGFLCLASPIGRYSQNVLHSGADGTFALALDLANTPYGGGTVAIQAGETWYFQAWFRDRNPAPTSNFTDGVSLTFR